MAPSVPPMLHLALVLLTAAAPPAPSESPTESPIAPAVHRLDVAAPGPIVERTTPAPARSLGLWWEGELGDVTATLLAGDTVLATWPLFEDLDQAPARFDDPAARPAGARHVSGLAHSYAGAFDRVRLTWTGDLRPRAVSLILVDAFEAPVQPDRPLPNASDAGAGDAPFPKPPVYARSTWGADAPQCGSSYCTTTHMAVHHTASSADYAVATWSQAAANVKAIQAYHMYTNGWCDVGYNYLVTKQGWIFEGRAGGDNVNGAHDGFNCGSMGVAVLGYFHTPVNNAPTVALGNALADLGAWKFDQQGIAPYGSSWYAGYGGTMTNVYGHRDVKATACPGDLLYATLGALRDAIAARLAGTPSNGTLKGVLYDASVGTSKRVQGTVALANGTFVKTGSDGYYEFPLAAGSYAFAGTAPGHTTSAGSETVTSGDVWESLGVWPASNVPGHSATDVGFNLFTAAFQGDPGSPVYLAYAGAPGIPLVNYGAAGTLWINLSGAQILYLGNVPGSGTLSVNLNAGSTPAGTTIHTQGYLWWQGQPRVTNGAAWIAP